MKLIVHVFVFLAATALSWGQGTNLNTHVYWDAVGNQQNHAWGFAGMDYLGQITDSISHAIAIGENAGSVRGNISSFVYNRARLDTVRHFEFPGKVVRRCNLNGDAFWDYVCWDGSNISFLLGTEHVDSFRTAFVLHNCTDFEYSQTNILIADCDSDGFDDVLLSERNYDGPGLLLGRIRLFRGGATLDSVPAAVLQGENMLNFVGGQLALGHVRDTKTLFVVEARWYHAKYNSDTVSLMLYPLGPNFRLFPSDTIVCHLDTLGTFSRGFLITDANGDSVDDIVLGAADGAQVFQGGIAVSPHPTYYFHKPVSTGSATFGQKLVNVGDVTGFGYPSLLVTDPDGDLAGGSNGGTIFLFNMGRALKDSCVAYASRQDFESYMGTTAISSGDVNGDGRMDFLVGRDESISLGPDHVGGLTQFLGSSDYGPVTVRELPVLPHALRLDQNYPNPFATTTDIAFAITDSRLADAEVTITLYDMLGDCVGTVYRGTADGFAYTVRLDATRLPAGIYCYRLVCGGQQLARRLSVAH